MEPTKKWPIKAQGLIMAVMVTALIFALAASFLAFSRYANEAGQRNLDTARAYYLAESGIELAKYALATRFDDATYTGTAAPIDFAGGTISVTVGAKDAVSGTRRVTSRGGFSKARQEIIKNYLKIVREQEVIWAAFSDGSLVKMDSEGNILWKKCGFNFSIYRHLIAVNPNDGVGWVGSSSANADVIKFSSNGRELARFSGFNSPCLLSVDPRDGSCWMAENGASQIIKIKSDNTLQRVGGFRSVGWITVDPRDGSCWVSDVGAYKVFKLSADGGQKIEINLGYHQPLYSALDSRDGSCWVAYGGPNIVVKFDSSGAPKANIGIHYPFSMAVSPLDGSLWFAVHDNTIKFDSEGKTLFTVPVHEHSVSANIPDGSCWIGFTKVSSNGTVLKSIRTKFHAYCNIALIERATNIEEAP